MTPSAQKTSHALSVMSAADEMRREEFICDFKINTGSKTFNAHRLILATNSGYFRSLFSSNVTEAKQGFVTMETIESTVMQLCIEYMYTSDCELQPDLVSLILHAANYLQISALERYCVNYLQKILCPDNALFIVNLARTFNHQDLESAAEDTIQKNLEIVISSELFKDVTEQDLLRYILNANYEVTWKALTTWCQDKVKEFPKLAENVNFPVFSFNFLLETVLKHSLVIKAENVKSIVIRALLEDSSRLKDNLNIKNCFSLKKIAIDHKSEEVILAFMEDNFSSIITEPEFYSLSKCEVLSLLNSLDVKPEESKWDAILQWVKKDENRRTKHFADLFRTVSLSKFPLQFLKETVRQEHLVDADATCITLLVDFLFNLADQGFSSSDEESSDEESSVSSIAHASPNEELYASLLGCISSDEESVTSHSEETSQTDPKIGIGTRVVRGPNWQWGDQDGNGEGTIVLPIDSQGWVKVKWDNYEEEKYRMGAKGKYDLEIL